MRREQLRKEPLCRRCAIVGRHTPASVVHHVIRHQGDPVKFFSSPLASVCADCHDKWEQQAEVSGFSCQVGDDGIPVDPGHPFHRVGWGEKVRNSPPAKAAAAKNA